VHFFIKNGVFIFKKGGVIMQEKIKLNPMILLKNPKNIWGVIMQEKNPCKPLSDKALRYALCNIYTIVYCYETHF